MNILVAGGAGFIGSQIVDAFLANNDRVIVVDGLLPETGGSPANLPDNPNLEVHFSRVEDLAVLSDLVLQSDLVVDAMGWTRHLLALERPSYDLSLNVSSHLGLIAAFPPEGGPRVIYLGSRGQYGNPSVAVIDESIPCVPQDIQGVHKQAGESHWRIASKLRHFPVASLRFGNTFGPRQPTIGRDIGLVGQFIRDLSNGNEIELFGEGRIRPLIYAPDLARAIIKIAPKPWEGFQSFNVSGWDVPLEALVGRLCKIMGHGSWRVAPFPEHVRMIDVGNAAFDGSYFDEQFGGFERSNFEMAICNTLKTLTPFQQ
jgi:UDP-glucose 4-epimerase